MVLGSPRVLGCAALLVLALGTSCKNAPSDGGSTTSVEPIPCDEDTPCPGDQVCLVGQCYDGEGPVLEIIEPPDEQLIAWSADTDTTTVTVSARATTRFELVDPEMDPESARGGGQIAFVVDGVDLAVISMGDAEDGVSAEVDVPSEGGPHRLRAEARLSDGRPYDNVGAVARSMFWFDDGAPRVAIKSPQPEQRFDLNQQEIDVTIATINFQLTPAEAVEQPGDLGHAHLFFNVTFPDCAASSACRESQYVAVIAPDAPSSHASVAPDLPSIPAPGTTTLSAYLVRTNHVPYCALLEDPCLPVYDTIAVDRREPGIEQPGADTTAGSSSGSATDTTGGSTGGSSSSSGGFVPPPDTGS